MAQVMAWCLTAPSHYLDFSLVRFCGMNLRAILPRVPQLLLLCIMSVKIILLKSLSHFPGDNKLDSARMNWRRASQETNVGTNITNNFPPINKSIRVADVIPTSEVNLASIWCSHPPYHGHRLTCLPLKVGHCLSKWIEDDSWFGTQTEGF